MINEAHSASRSYVQLNLLHRVHTAIKISGVNSTHEQTTASPFNLLHSSTKQKCFDLGSSGAGESQTVRHSTTNRLTDVFH